MYRYTHRPGHKKLLSQQNYITG